MTESAVRSLRSTVYGDCTDANWRAVIAKEGSYQRICAWCRRALPGHDPAAREVSHGICHHCAEQEVRV